MNQNAAQAASSVSKRISAVLFADVVDSVRLVQQDEVGAINRWRTFVAEVTHDELPQRRGRIVKALGDGMLIEFPSAVDAMGCALGMQTRIARSNEGLAPARKMQLRIGVHLAEVFADDLDLYGDGINLAARLMALAAPGETLLSAAFRDVLTDGLDVVIEDLGNHWLKGFDKPVRAFRAWPPGPMFQPSTDHQRRRVGGRPSFAVLPFRNPNPEAAHAFLADMLAEDLIAAISRQTDLIVISRLSTAPFRDRLYEPRNVAEILGVRYLLSGTLQTSGTRLRLMAELTEADEGQVIWAERFDGTLTDVFELQDQLSRDIVKRVVPRVRQRELARVRLKRPDNLTAYERTLQAIDHIHRSAPENLEYARTLLEAAIESDPHYAAPYAWLARYHVRRIGQGWSSDPKADTETANRYSAAALERDETDPWVITIHGFVIGYLNKDLERALQLFDQALEINPSLAHAWIWSASALAWLGRGEEAVLRAPKSSELSPFDPNMYSFDSISAVAHAVAGNYETSIEYSRRSLRQNSMYAASHRTLAIALALAGRLDQARKAVDQLLTLEPGLTVSSFALRYPGRNATHAPVFYKALADAGVPP